MQSLNRHRRRTHQQPALSIDEATDNFTKKTEAETEASLTHAALEVNAFSQCNFIRADPEIYINDVCVEAEQTNFSKMLDDLPITMDSLIDLYEHEVEILKAQI